MGMIYLGGAGFNLWGRGTEINTYTNEDTRLTASPAMETAYPVARIHDGFPSQTAIWASNGDPSRATLYLQQLKNGELDDWTAGDPDEWTATRGGAGTVVEDAAIKLAGSSANCSCTAAAGTFGLIDQLVSVRPGESLRHFLYMRGDTLGGGDAAIAQIINMNTGMELNSSGNWVASAAWASENGAAFVQHAINFAVEDFEACNYEQWVQLRIRCRSFISTGAAARDAWFDRVRLVPRVDFLSIHGHNLGGADTVVELHGSVDFFAADDRTILTLTNAKPTMWARAASLDTSQQYRLEIVGAQGSTLLGNKLLGEVVLGQATEAEKSPNIRYGTIRHDAQMRSADALGEQRVFRRGPPRRRLDMRFFGGDSSYNEALHEFVHRMDLGGYPMVVIPDSSKADGAVYGRVNRERSDVRTTETTHRWGMVVDELPLPTVIP